MKILESILITMRPHRMPRVAIIFLPLIFSGAPLNFVYLLKILVGFFIFCLLTGAINIIEDITRREKDREDNIKRLMPVASGELSVNKAEFAIGAVLIGCFVASFFLGSGFGLMAIAYFFISLAYFLFLNKLIFIDAITTGVNSALLITAGTFAISKPISAWLMFFVFSITIFMVFSSRMRDIIISKKIGEEPSKIYSEKDLEQTINITASLAVMVYSLYCLTTFDGMRYNLIYTIPFVIYGTYRTLYLMNDNVTEKPLERLLIKDVLFVGNLAVWVVLTSVLLAVF